MHLKDDELVTGLKGPDGSLDLLAATFARVTTAVGFTRMMTPLGNYFIARPAARAAGRKITEETDMPLDAAVALGLSATALHVWSADPMLNQIHEYLGHVPLERITAIKVTPGRQWQKLAITLQDGHEVDLQGRGASHQLEAAFGKLKDAG